MTGNSTDDEAAALIEDPRIQLPVVAQRNERVARKGFWRKLARVAGKIPFAEDATAAYYCAIDPGTPMRVRATLFAAITYFIVPTDLVPDVIAAFGFTDDATVLTTAIAIVGSHIKDHHRTRARRTLRQGDFEDA
ncbi:YkvA family protein [Pyruvatibacter sp.]|uniref:YkvA family protein n=1 Tax=Pyruvatibacter sp. TaxID=1981328 RepID=UPI0032EE1A75